MTGFAHTVGWLQEHDFSNYLGLKSEGKYIFLENVDMCMKSRRKILAAIGTGTGIALAGCLGNDDGGTEGDCTIENSTASVDSVTFSLDGRVSGASVELDVRWNARAQAKIDSRTPNIDEDEKYVLYRLAISNPTDEDVEVGSRSFSLEYETPNVRNDARGLVVHHDETLDRLVELRSGGEIAGTYTHIVPEQTTGATLEAVDVTRSPIEDVDTTVAFNPQCDESLPIGIPE